VTSFREEIEIMIRFRSARLAAVLAIAGGLTGLAAQDDAARPRQLQANGVNISYIEQGSGTPVVFAHGAVGDLRFWEPQRQAIAAGHRFVAYSYRYHGTGPWPDDGARYSAETHAADLAAFIAGLNAGPVHLVGLSYGGLLAALVAKDRPELVRTLTLAEPALFSLLAEKPESKPAQEAQEAWTKAITPVVAAVQAGDAVGATKLLVDVVTNEGPGAFDKQPESVRQMLLDNARTLPVLFAHPAPAVSCDALRAVKAPTLVVAASERRSFSRR
jgi:pimeloyl-ACP methyl ester carboxylesterase